jgi:hypothetical protein
MIKKLIKSAIGKPFNLVGYNVSFSKMGISSISTVDKNIWEPYFRPNHKMLLYFEGLKRSRVESSDNFYKQLRHYSLQQMIYYVLRQELSGDFVECGVWKGHSAYIISSILSENEFTGDFHIFDSFEGGLSDKVEKDMNLRRKLIEEQIQEESNIFHSTEEEVKSCLSSFNFIHLYKGWIPNRFNEIEGEQFSFVHIDVDLYEPTWDCLNFFYPKLVENGVIVCDDYGFCQFPGAKKAVDEFLEKNSYKMFYEVPMGGCFIIK